MSPLICFNKQGKQYRWRTSLERGWTQSPPLASYGQEYYVSAALVRKTTGLQVHSTVGACPSFFYWSLAALQCCISFCCRQSESATHICTPPFVTTEHWALFPVRCGTFSLVTCFIHSSVYMSVPTSQAFPPPLPPLASMHLFFTTVSLLLPCK